MTHTPRRLERMVVDASRVAPDRIAVVDAGGAWTYAELNDQCHQLAGDLAQLGVRAGDRVAIWAPKSCRTLAAMQAVLRLGAAYVPIDSTMPPPRARTILDDCGVRAVVTTSVHQAHMRANEAVLLLDSTSRRSSDRQTSLPMAPTDVNALAYVLYTSGSTGTPKGVCISHANALAFVDWAVAETGVESASVFANHASLTFDLSVFDLYGAFRTASTVCLVPESIAYSAAALGQFLCRHRIDVWYSVPSALVLMLDHGSLPAASLGEPSLVIFAGEPFPVASLRRLRDHWRRARMFNFYGPTETNVCTSYEVVDAPAEGVSSIPIGRAASGDRVWLIKDDGTDAEVGERGELYVDGPTVMAGYWGAAPQRGPYPTGDICVRRADGNYEFVGRRDHMIKVRGHRVELGEIEAVLGQHPDVAELAVLPIGIGVEQRLVAFVAPKPQRVPTLVELKAFGAKYLPRYMLVHSLLIVPALPRTANGKIDRSTLVSAAGACDAAC